MARLRTHSVWIAVGILAVLAVWLYFDLKRPTREPDENPKIAEIVGMKADEVTRVEVATGDKTIALVKSAASWSIEQPVKAPADAEAVKRALDDILDQSTDYIMEKAPADLSRWGLAKPTKTVALSGAGKRVLLQIGNQDPAKSSYFTRLAEGGKVFLVGSYALEGLTNKSADDFRDKTILSIARDTIEQIRLRKDRGTITLVRAGGKWSLTEPARVPADEFAADGIADVLATLKGEKFVAADATDLAKYGLDKPRLIVEVQAKGGAQYGVRIGKEAPGGTAVYAARTSNGNVLEVAKSTFDTLNKGTSDLRSRKVLDVETDRVERIAVVSRKVRWEARKSGSDWIFVEPNAGKKADGIDVDNIILDATASADRWVADNPSEADLAKYGLLKPETTVTLTIKGGGAKKLEIGRKSSQSDYFVRGTDTGNSVFAIGSYVVDRLQNVPKVENAKPK